MRLTSLATALLLVVSVYGQMENAPHWPSPESLTDWAADEVFKVEMNVAETYVEANRLIIEENWVEAEALMAVLFEGSPANRNFAYKWALCLRAIPGRLAEAVPLVSLAVDGEFAKRYNAFSIDETLPPEEALELGLDVLQQSYHFSEAQALAEVMVARYSKRDFRHLRALEVMEECDFAMECTRYPIPMSIYPETALNSTSSDYAPVVTPDGQTMYFTSNREKADRQDELGQIYRSMKTDGRWSNPVRLDIGMPGRDVTTVGIIGDDEALLAYQGFRNEGSVWKLMRDDIGGWTIEEKLGFPIDSRHWETSMSERFDGWERIFVSDRPGGEGGRDLYRTVRLPDGTWSEPLNLGRRINTTGDEESPILSADGQMLVFASKGHPGMGGFDLFRCRRLDNGSWSDPEHLGHPLNTPGDEAVLSLDASGSAGYISSTRGGGYDLDIYRVEFLDDPGEELAVMIGEVMAWRKGDVMEVKSVDGGPAIFRVFRARKGSGKFLAALPPCREYEFSWVRGGETLMERRENIGCDAAYGADNVVLRLDPFTWGDNVEPALPEVSAEENAATADGQTAPSVGGGEMTESAVVSDENTASTAAQPVEAAGSGSETAAAAPESMTGAGASGGAADPSGVAETAAAPEDPAEVAAAPAAAPVTMIEFSAVTEQVDFGYGKYVPQAGSRSLVSMALSIIERNQAGEVPVLQIAGSASFVPVKNKRAYASNEQLAKMRAEHARDAMITELAKRGLQVGVDYQIVLEWSVAGPDYRGDAVTSADTYRNYQYAKFSLSRTLVEKRG